LSLLLCRQALDIRDLIEKLNSLVSTLGKRTGVSTLIVDARKRLGALTADLDERTGPSKLFADGLMRLNVIKAHLDEITGARNILEHALSLIRGITRDISGSIGNALGRAGLVLVVRQAPS